jgi:hypothetical protein
MRTDGASGAQVRRRVLGWWRVPMALVAALALTWCALKTPPILHRWRVDRKLDAIQAGMSVKELQNVLGVPPTPPEGSPVGCIPGTIAYVFSVSPHLTVVATYGEPGEVISTWRHDGGKDRTWVTENSAAADGHAISVAPSQ